MSDHREHITVCVCTYRRPRRLEELLQAIAGQGTAGRFTFSAAVVDNDRNETARVVVEQARSRLAVTYDVEPVQSISLARNRAVRNASGCDGVAFIDDDEIPPGDWLLRLHEALHGWAVDGVLGPVLPLWDVEPPRWLVRSRLLERRRYRTGTLLDNSRFMRTGNVLLSGRVFDGILEPFDPRFGLTGGEDSDFFTRMVRSGRRFVWCDEAAVHERVPAERMTRNYFVRRALLRGEVTAAKRAGWPDLVKSCIAVCLYAAILPVLVFAGQAVLMRFIISGCDHLGKILGSCGVRLVDKRSA